MVALSSFPLAKKINKLQINGRRSIKISFFQILGGEGGGGVYGPPFEFPSSESRFFLESRSQSKFYLAKVKILLSFGENLKPHNKGPKSYLCQFTDPLVCLDYHQS